MSRCNLCIAKKKTGDICNKPGKFNIENNYYCGIHFKQISRNNTNITNTICTIDNNKINSTKEIIINEDVEFNYIKQVVESKINFKINNYISTSTYGTVYSTNDANYNIKLLYHKKNNSQILKRNRDLLFWEYMILTKHFYNNNNIIKLYNSKDSYMIIKDEKYIIVIIIIESYYETLYDRFTRSKFHFSDNQIKNYGIQLIKTIKTIHSKGYLYIDFNLTNFIFKNIDSENIIYIDFTLCEKYINIQGIHNEQSSFKHTIGTDMFSSIFCNGSKSSDRVGDLQSIGYILLYLYHNNLPWSNKKNSTSILKNKKIIKDTCIFNNSPKYLQDFIIESYNYDYSDKPYYDNFITILS